MGRRSLHTSDELRELILSASTSLIRESGLAGLSAREIARRIDYSPGTLYNVFENLDDLVFTIEGRLLDGLLESVSGIEQFAAPEDRIYLLAERYLSYTQENAKLWSLLFEHHLPGSAMVPAWYQQKLEQLIIKIETALEPAASGLDRQSLRRAALVIWSGLYGISALSSTQKLAIMTGETAGVLLDDLLRTYFCGLVARATAEAGEATKSLDDLEAQS